MTPCREWQGPRINSGYGKRYNRTTHRHELVHRAVYEMAEGPIPEGMLVLHRCDNRACFRFDHLFLGTAADNMQDASSKGRLWHQNDTHCKNGHPWDESNTYWYRGRRSCRACNRANVAQGKAHRERRSSTL